MTGYSTGSDNTMSSDGTYNYTYDADGNRTARTQISNSYSNDYKTTYTWDYRDRLTDVQNYDNNNLLKQHVHYVYDVFDHLIATEVDPTGGGTYTQIQHDALDLPPEIPAAGVPGRASGQPVLVFDGSGNLTGRNLAALNAAGVDAALAQEAVSSLSQGGAVNWMIGDNQGSVRVVLDSSSNVLDRITYNPFGTIAYESAPSTNHWAGFASGHVDPSTGLINEGERWLDAATGGWLSQDPLNFLAGDTNLSRYVTNGPTNATDPSGLFQYPVTTVSSGAGFTTSTGGIGHYWSVVRSDGASAWGIDLAPGANLGSWTATTGNYVHWSASSYVTTPPPENSDTSVYSMMVANDPTLAPRAEQAKGQIQALAAVSITFTAGGPVIKPAPINWKPLVPYAAAGALGAGIALAKSRHQLAQEIEHLENKLQRLQDKLESILDSSKGQAGGIGPYNTGKTEQDITQTAQQLGELQAELKNLGE